MSFKNNISKILIGLMAGLVVIGTTSCGDTSWAMEIDGQKLPAGIYLINQSTALNQASSEEGYDEELKDKWDNKIGDLKLEEWVNNKAKDLTKRYVVVENLFKEKGLTLTEEEVANVESNVEYLWTYTSETYEKLGVSKDSYYKSMENQAKQEAIFKKIYGKDGEKAVSDDDLKKYYADNYLKVNVASYSTKNAETGKDMTEEEKKDVENKANEDLKRIQEGTSIATILEELNPSASQTNEDGTTQAVETPTEEETQIEIHKEGNNQISDELTKQIFEKAVINQPVLLSDENGFYIVKSYETSLKNEEIETKRLDILYRYKLKEFEAYLDDLGKDLKSTENKNAINTFKPKKWDN